MDTEKCHIENLMENYMNHLTAKFQYRKSREKLLNFCFAQLKNNPKLKSSWIQQKNVSTENLWKITNIESSHSQMSIQKILWKVTKFLHTLLVKKIPENNFVFWAQHKTSIMLQLKIPIQKNVGKSLPTRVEVNCETFILEITSARKYFYVMSPHKTEIPKLHHHTSKK